MAPPFDLQTLRARFENHPSIRCGWITKQQRHAYDMTVDFAGATPCQLGFARYVQTYHVIRQSAQSIAPNDHLLEVVRDPLTGLRTGLRVCVRNRLARLRIRLKFEDLWQRELATRVATSGIRWR